jgi:gluconate 5-dehydrogenase
VTNPFDLSGAWALVTGSSRGIGLAIAEGLAEAGAGVVLNGVDRGRLDAAEEALAARYGTDRVRSARFDVSDETEVEEAVAAVEEGIGPIGILVNSAGIQHRVPMLDLDVEDWRRVIDVDLTASFIVGRAVARRMIPRGSGKIINVCSVQTDLARPTIAPYTAAKGGLRNLTRAMTAEWASSGLQINGIAPGYIHTEMTQDLVDDAAFDSWIRGRTPAGRWGRVEDLTGPAVWLASRASDYVNGQVVFIDGGMSVVV